MQTTTQLWKQAACSLPTLAVLTCRLFARNEHGFPILLWVQGCKGAKRDPRVAKHVTLLERSTTACTAGAPVYLLATPCIVDRRTHYIVKCQQCFCNRCVEGSSFSKWFCEREKRSKTSPYLTSSLHLYCSILAHFTPPPISRRKGGVG